MQRGSPQHRGERGVAFDEDRGAHDEFLVEGGESAGEDGAGGGVVAVDELDERVVAAEADALVEVAEAQGAGWASVESGADDVGEVGAGG